MIIGTDEELVRFCFDTYDLNDDGYISREEMLLLLKDCMYKSTKESAEEDGDDGVKDLIEMTMRKMDQDRDGRVSYSDFMATVQAVNDNIKILSIQMCFIEKKLFRSLY